MRGCILLLPVLLLACLSGCVSHRQGVTEHGFFSTGMPNVLIQTDQKLTPVASGSRSVAVPSGANSSASGTFSFAVFADVHSKQTVRHAHTGIATLAGNTARFTMERERESDAFLLDKETTDGRFWTLRLMPVFAEDDWFSALRRANNLPTPPLWLAKRWSWTPDSHTRVVAEYREAAPMCLQETLPGKDADGKNRPQRASRAEILRRCSRDIDDFSLRAEKVFTFGRADKDIQAAAAPAFVMPESAPNMQKLVGGAEVVGRDSFDSNR